MPSLSLLYRKLSLLEITNDIQICDKILKSQKTEPFDQEKAKDKYFLKELDNNNNNNGLRTDPLDGFSLLKHVNYN